MPSQDKKKILFPCTNRVHISRQKLLLSKLSEDFNLIIWEYEPFGNSMTDRSIETTIRFVEELRKHRPDLVLIRGDRFEMLPLTMYASYERIPVAHLEGGDLSGVIDGKVRHSISHLADYHFPTNEQSERRLISMGIPADRIWNYGSLDCEFALSVEPKRIREGSYILVMYHPVPNEDTNEFERGLIGFNTVRILSNSDYSKTYGSEQYSPEDLVNLMRYAECVVGNSSALIKEASVLQVRAVLVGDRQKGRLLPSNIIQVPCDEVAIRGALINPYYHHSSVVSGLEPYYQPDTAKNIAGKLKEIMYG